MIDSVIHVFLAAAIVIAKPEVRATVHVGDVLVLPLRDARGSAAVYGNALRKLGIRTRA